MVSSNVHNGALLCSRFEILIEETSDQKTGKGPLICPPPDRFTYTQTNPLTPTRTASTNTAKSTSRTTPTWTISLKQRNLYEWTQDAFAPRLASSPRRAVP